MKKITIGVVVIAALMVGYALGKTHETHICLDASAVDILLVEDVAQSSTKPEVSRASYQQTEPKSKYPDYWAVQKRYKELRPKTVTESFKLPEKDRWRACDGKYVSLTYEFNPDPEQDVIMISEAKKP